MSVSLQCLSVPDVDGVTPIAYESPEPSAAKYVDDEPGLLLIAAEHATTASESKKTVVRRMMKS